MTVDFIGIGTAKSGTTWLTRKLNTHPQISISEPKEIGYFNYYLPHSKLEIRDGRPPVNPRFTMSREQYLKHFRYGNGLVKGEFTNAYFSDPRAPGRIRDEFPDAKLILSLRNPIDRAYSHYQMRHHFFKLDPRKFPEVISIDEPYIDRGMYAKHLERWLHYFSKEQIHIIFFDDIVSEPAKVLERLTGFLGCEPHKFDLSKENVSRVTHLGPLPLWMDRTKRYMTQRRMRWVVRALKKAGIPQQLMRIASRRNNYGPMKEETRAQLRDLFTSDVTRLEEMCGRKLDWV